MNTFIGVKLVKAKPMTRLEYNNFRGWVLPGDENGDDAGFLVEYVDGGKANTESFAGYVSWSPADVFERAYRPVDGLTFGDAIEALKAGKRVARAGWNGKGMWLGLHTEGGTFIREECGTEIEYADYITMKTADNKLVPWLASQTDMLAEDWAVVA
jgi:hypothetical protein